MSSPQQYKLSAELLGHSADVRTVCALNNGFVCTGSRDRAIRVWAPSSIESIRTIYAHEHFLASLTTLAPSQTTPDQLFASGGNDKVIYVWDTTAIIPCSNDNGDVQPLLTLIGHTDTVCALASTQEGDIVSGSWDKTARIWRCGQSVQELRGHEQAVWAVLSLPNGDIVTGSADRTVKIWRGVTGMMQCIATLQRHTDCVRGLALLQDVGFVSCGNDGIVVLWSFSGEVLQELHGHTAFVYGVAVLADSRIISCGEDRTLRIWEGGECVQTIVHPATVWSVAALPNGDIASGGSDGVARVWTRDATRVADSLALGAYEKTLAATAVHKATVGDVQLDKLPSVDALDNPGRKDGDNIIVRVGNSAEVYTWSSGDNRWTKIGEVVDSAASGKKELNGKEYDYVFDVDLDGGQIKKIGYNNGDNPYEVAQEFLWREDLGQDYLDQVAKFIIQNVSNAPVVLGSTRPAEQNLSVPPASVSSKYFPQRLYVLFESSNLSGLLQKIEEFDGKEEATILSEGDRRALTGILQILKETSKYHSSKLGNEQYQLLVKLLSWPPQYLLPVLDLLRLLFLHPHAAEVFASPPRVIIGKHVDILSYLLDVLNSQIPNPTNTLLVLRSLANMFCCPATRKILEVNYERVLKGVAGSGLGDDRVALAASTVILNYGVCTLTTKGGETKYQGLVLLKDILKSAILSAQPDLLMRVLVAIGTFVWEDSKSVSTAHAVNIKSELGRVPVDKVATRECVATLSALL